MVDRSRQPAIRARELAKKYRRTRAGFRFRTLKSALLERSLTGGLGSEDVITAVDQVSFEVGEGQAFGVIGGNGSGKSTLLKLVAGLLKPSGGSVEVHGRVAPLIELGAGFHPEISGLENIFINGAVLGLRRAEIERRLDEIISFSGLGDFIDEPVKNYSSGMYVRLGFAVAIHTDPEVLLVDEVLAVGDEAFAHKCIHRIEEHLRGGGSLLFVSHSLDLVERLCDRVLWLENGVQRALGEPREVIDAYRQAVAEAEAEEQLEEQHRQRDQPPEEVELVEEDEAKDRWGSGVATIHSATMLVDGAESYLLPSGGNAEFVLEVEAHEPLEDFVVGIAVTTPRGVDCWGTNTGLLDYQADSFSGAATIRITCEDLRLAAGDYEVDFALHARDGAPYDYRRRCLRFVVQGPKDGVGIFRPNHRWSFEGGIAWRDSSISSLNQEGPRSAAAQPSEVDHE